MRIEGPSQFLNSEDRVERGDQKHGSNKGQRADQVEDQLNLSLTSQQLREFENKAYETPEVRTEKVQEILDQVTSGTYDINAEEVAEAIITGTIVNKSA
jgi:flagellar biosynthesis anti-sigma factor FlgM